MTLTSQLGYGNIYQHKLWSIVEKKVVEVPGLPTSPKTRPFMLNNLAKMIREEPELFVDVLFWDECLSFVRNEKGRPEAQEGSYDDMVLAAAGAHWVRLIRLGYVDPLILKKMAYGIQQEEL